MFIQNPSLSPPQRKHEEEEEVVEEAASLEKKVASVSRKVHRKFIQFNSTQLRDPTGEEEEAQREAGGQSGSGRGAGDQEREGEEIQGSVNQAVALDGVVEQ